MITETVQIIKAVRLMKIRAVALDRNAPQVHFVPTNNAMITETVQIIKAVAKRLMKIRAVALDRNAPVIV